MRVHYAAPTHQAASCRAFTLVEVVIAIAIAALSIGGVIYGYVNSAQRAEWSSYSLAAQSMAMQRIEQARACRWDPRGFPPRDELVNSNFADQVLALDVPMSGTNIVYATNRTTISVITAAPPLRMIRVECVWRFQERGLFTNLIVTYRGPDQ